MMRVVVSYDIQDDRLRRQVSKVCEAYGQRVQYSVFECDLTKEQMQEFKDRLNTQRRNGQTTPTDSIRLYSLCSECSGKVEVIGYRPPLATEQKAIVIGS